MHRKTLLHIMTHMQQMSLNSEHFKGGRKDFGLDGSDVILNDSHACETNHKLMDQPMVKCNNRTR
eukprot:6133799-Amphidinium_carterae.1